MFNQPMKSKAHNVLEKLSKRTTLTGEQNKLFNRLTAGHNGELQFFKALKTELRSSPIPLFNLCLRINGSECQIDSLLIFQNELILFEVKAYQGDFLIKNDNWYTISKKEIRNPLHQLQRTQLLFQELLDKHQSPLKIRSYIIFIHPGFHLYHAPINLPIVFPTQLKRFIQKLQNIPCRIQKHHRHLASLLKSGHQTSSPHESIPNYDYLSLRKGVTCDKCSGFLVVQDYKSMRCMKCEFVGQLEEAIMKSVWDYCTLFPEENPKLKTIADWIDNCISYYRLRKILAKHGQLVAQGAKSYYILSRELPKL